ncbi:hypothetical protein V1L54_16480 [Streptomyces sp. TRM 70361]|uniref:hypothetical protein n=1 Tax=Streptomyces sp. TRM 70361 TaxID=3116553 RepID=UPI002E7B9C17|nr:hypothetical protein [Streptomyces sp. TRM 70361]MEE1940981.1 hypothetical protein [Streptomyces sp. TRM 70361]
MSDTHTGQDRQDHGERDRGARGGTAGRPESPVGVLIGADGSATIDGEPLRVPEGEPVHVAVLDAVHRRARARGEPVEAVILDGQEGDVTLVEVAPDGSSRLLRHEEHGGEHDKEHGGTPGAEPRPAAGRPPADVPPPEPAPAGPAHPDGAPTGAADARVPEAVPPELAELVGLVCRSLDAGARERAAALAFRLREYTVRAFGPEHPHTLEAHALEAFVAHRSGNHRLATVTCLELARIRHRQGDPRVRTDLTRAAAAWLLNDDLPSAVDHGRTLLAAVLAVWPEHAEQGGAAVPDAAVPHLVNRRMHALTAGSATGVTGAA